MYPISFRFFYFISFHFGLLFFSPVPYACDALDAFIRTTKGIGAFWTTIAIKLIR